MDAEIKAEADRIRRELSDICYELQDVSELHAAESILISTARILDMPWVCWAPETSYPYYCREMDEFTSNVGWPKELLNLWWNRHAMLKRPLHIRCRFENLPFASLLSGSHQSRAANVSAEQHQVNKLIGEMGISTMLTLPVHLPKGQIAIVNWAGGRDIELVEGLLKYISGDLLWIGHRFMRIANARLGRSLFSKEERSTLTPREWDCLRSLAQGYRESEIASVIGISRTTVRSHLDNVVEKFGCKNRAQAIAMAAQLGLLGQIGS